MRGPQRSVWRNARIQRIIPFRNAAVFRPRQLYRFLKKKKVFLYKSESVCNIRSSFTMKAIHARVENMSGIDRRTLYYAYDNYRQLSCHRRERNIDVTHPVWSLMYNGRLHRDAEKSSGSSLAWIEFSYYCSQRGSVRYNCWRGN